MDYLPIFLDVRRRFCLVVGGGPVALRKVELLVQAGARVRIVAPKLCRPLSALAKRAKLEVFRRTYTTRDLRGVCLAVAATERAEVNARVAAEAQARMVPVNVVDQPALCSFIMPAIVDRGGVVVAVSTSGASPVLARLTRARLEATLPPLLGELADFAKRHRALVQRELAGVPARRAFWEWVFEGEIGALVLSGQVTRAEAALHHALKQPAPGSALPSVVLIGAGKGDPALLSLAAARALGRAELIVHERRVPAAVLALGRRDAETMTIGLSGASYDRGWRRILVKARLGRTTCIVRMGDLARFGEAREARLLRSAGVAMTLLRPAPG